MSLSQERWSRMADMIVIDDVLYRSTIYEAKWAISDEKKHRS